MRPEVAEVGKEVARGLLHIGTEVGLRGVAAVEVGKGRPNASDCPELPSILACFSLERTGTVIELCRLYRLMRWQHQVRRVWPGSSGCLKAATGRRRGWPVRLLPAAVSGALLGCFRPPGECPVGTWRFPLGSAGCWRWCLPGPAPPLCALEGPWGWPLGRGGGNGLGGGRRISWSVAACLHYSHPWLLFCGANLLLGLDIVRS